MSNATEGQIQWMPVCAVCGSSSIFDSKYGTDDGWCDYCDDFVDSKKIDVRDYTPDMDNDQAIEENMEEAMDAQEKLNNSLTEEQVRHWVGKGDPITFLTNLINEEDEAGFSGHGFNLELLRTEIEMTPSFTEQEVMLHAYRDIDFLLQTGFDTNVDDCKIDGIKDTIKESTISIKAR